jgi:RNA polymerase sigma-70 factor (ECF subfamily)
MSMGKAPLYSGTRMTTFGATHSSHAAAALAAMTLSAAATRGTRTAPDERSEAEVRAPARAPEAAKVAVDEKALCTRALGGDEDAWNALVTKHDHRVVVSLLARGVRLDRAKDIAQEAWIRLVEQQRAGRLSHLVLPGLAIAQAAFLSLEAARRDVRGEALLPLVPLEADGVRLATDLVDPAADAETRLLTSERIARAEKVLGGFAPNAREVFRLAYGGEGLSHAEVARRVGLSLQRVRQILCEVRKELKLALEGEGDAS